MPFKIVRNDITKMNVDVIVNTANEAPIYSSGVDTAVYHAAGEDKLLEERKKIGWMKEGDVAITPGFMLPAKYIIHAVSPCYIDGTFDEEKKLRRCYRKSLKLAYKNNCKSIAFPLISTGNFGYPKEEGMYIALDEIRAFLDKHDMLVYLVVFDMYSTRLGKYVYPELETYIDNNYVREQSENEYNGTWKMPEVTGVAPPFYVFCGLATVHKTQVEQTVPEQSKENKKGAQRVGMPKKQIPSESVKDKLDDSDCLIVPNSADDYYFDDESYETFLEEKESALKKRMKHISDTFQQYLLFLMKQKGLSPSQVYKRAIITKQLFSKIKLNPNYHPDKATAMRLCVGAELNLDETKDLLARAGYALSPCDKRDIIFSFFIENKIHDMIEIDIALEEHDLPCFIE